MSEEKLNYKIVIPDVDTLTSGPDDLDLAPLDQFGRVVAVDTADQDRVKEELKDADAILVNKIEINEELLGSNPSVKFVGLFATGYNNVDLEYCNAHGITVCNVPTYSTNAVAQQTFAFILEHYTNLSKYNGFVQEGGWVNSGTFAPFVFPLSELSSKTIGLIGYGKIGHQVAKIARAFGMDVLVYTRSYEQAKSAGLKVGAYFFSQAINIEEAKEEADAVIYALGGKKLDYPVAFDWEYIEDDFARTEYVNNELTDIAVAFCNEIEKNNLVPIIYSNTYLMYYVYDMTRLKDYDFWVADYGDYPTMYYGFTMWQYSTDTILPDMDSPIDLNLCFKNY